METFQIFKGQVLEEECGVKVEKNLCRRNIAKIICRKCAAKY